MLNRKIGKSVLVWTLLFTMMCSSMVFAVSPSEVTNSEGLANGTAMGTLDGDAAGRADRNANRGSNFLSVMPNDVDIITRHKLNMDSLPYQNSFLYAYRSAFQIAYNTGFREVNVALYTTPITAAYEQGNLAGTAQGQLSAMIDFTQSNKDNWEKAYNAFIADGSLNTRYMLDRESAAYRSYFSSGYKEAFMSNYISTFQIKNLETEIRSKNARLISMIEETVSFEEEYVHFNLGDMESEMRTPMSLYIPEATVYEPTYFAAFKTQNSFNKGNTKLTPVSSKYTVSVWNDSGSVKLKRPITLSFEYFGSERAGIYQWINNKWVYQFTTLTNGSIFTTIPAGYYSGGEYAIFIDEDYKTVKDITFNWAYKEIYSLMRRDIVSDAVAYMPNAKITKGQLAQMIYNVVGVKDSIGTSIPSISDAASLGSYKYAVEYMVGKKYMTLDSKGNFNPNSTVSYLQVEEIFGSILLRDVKWSEISSKMLTEKFAKSQGIVDKNAALTKAEAAYMMVVFYK